MQVQFYDKAVNVWKISLSGKPEAWVADALSTGAISWQHLPDGHIKFLVIGKYNFKGLTGLFGTKIGQIGDYLTFDGVEYGFMTEKEFKKFYQQ